MSRIPYLPLTLSNFTFDVVPRAVLVRIWSLFMQISEYSWNRSNAIAGVVWLHSASIWMHINISRIWLYDVVFLWFLAKSVLESASHLSMLRMDVPSGIFDFWLICAQDPVVWLHWRVACGLIIIDTWFSTQQHVHLWSGHAHTPRPGAFFLNTNWRFSNVPMIVPYVVLRLFCVFWWSQLLNEFPWR